MELPAAHHAPIEVVARPLRVVAVGGRHDASPRGARATWVSLASPSSGSRARSCVTYLHAMRFVLVALVVAAVAGCPRPTSGPQTLVVEEEAGAPPAPCVAFAARVCAKEEKCRLGRLRSVYGDRARCAERQSLQCELAFAAPATGMNVDALRACADATEAATCDALPWELGACPAIHGALPAMALCVHDAACAEGTCSARSWTEPNPCYRCRFGGRDGDGCGITAGCADGFVCEMKVCTAASKIGEGCMFEELCGPRASCVVERDGQSRCRALAVQGESCRGEGDDRSELPRCDVDAGLACVDGQCAASEWLPAGAKCTSDYDVAHRCLGGDCVEGVCAPLPKEGRPCDPRGCLPPASCFGDEGCQLPSAKRCVAK